MWNFMYVRSILYDIVAFILHCIYNMMYFSILNSKTTCYNRPLGRQDQYLGLGQK